jgi:hypothetical protein
VAAPSARVARRRRWAAAALGTLALGAVASGVAVGGHHSSSPRRAVRPAAARPPGPPQLPRGGRTIFPGRRVVAYYGAPGNAELGILGIGTPRQAGLELRHQAARYRRPARPVLPAMELIAAVATHSPGDDGLYRRRQPDAVIARYLAAARRARALLILDIQPGHADFEDEAHALERWLREPDVGLALDPEWHTPGRVPGTAIGSVSGAQVNRISSWLAELAARGRLPQKLLVVHRFTPAMIIGQPLRVRRGVAVVVNVDGFGDRPNKLAKYHELAPRAGGLRRGIKLFFHEDTDLMAPRDVLRLRPSPDFVVYE